MTSGDSPAFMSLKAGLDRHPTKGNEMESRTTLQRLRERREVESGFTLIELLIVIVILGILAAIVVFAVGTSTKDAKTSACQSDVATVQTAVEAYAAQHDGNFPSSVATLTTASNGHGPWLRTDPGDVTIGSGGAVTSNGTGNCAAS